ncbi:MAG: prepilin-type N-terminal cleavage/methylation domain-containing protein [Candidatus Brocadiia bacterium]
MDLLHNTSAGIKPDLGRTEAGFTLLELIVTSVLAAMVMMSVYSVFNSGITVWNATYEASNTDNIYLNIERINRELSGMLNFAPIGFTCDNRRMTFPAMVNAPTEDKNTTASDQIPAEPAKTFGRPGWISYWFNADKGELSRNQGVYGKRLTDDKYQVLLTELKDVSFSFVKTETAGSSEQGFLPQTVKIEIQTKDKTFTRTIYIPLSKAAKNEQR